MPNIKEGRKGRTANRLRQFRRVMMERINANETEIGALREGKEPPSRSRRVGMESILSKIYWDADDAEGRR